MILAALRFAIKDIKVYKDITRVAELAEHSPELMR